jgi:hypothetical protein
MFSWARKRIACLSSNAPVDAMEKASVRPVPW